MSTVCFMKKSNGQNCGSMVYWCAKCGAVSCMRDGYRNQNWANLHCVCCGNMQREPVR